MSLVTPFYVDTVYNHCARSSGLLFYVYLCVLWILMLERE